MLSMKSNTSWFFSSRKYSAIGERRAERRADGRPAARSSGRKTQRDLGLREVLLVDDASLGHFVVEIVALAGALTDAGEHGETAVRLGDVVDEFDE